MLQGRLDLKLHKIARLINAALVICSAKSELLIADNGKHHRGLRHSFIQLPHEVHAKWNVADIR